MRICIVGGIFDKPAEYRAQHSISPETVLADGLRRRGWHVTLHGHSRKLRAGPFDLVHVHHFGRTALRLASAAHRPAFVLTTHDPFAMNGLPIGWRRRLTDGFVLRKADAVVALSHAERAFLVRRHAIRTADIAVIPNGIDTTVFDQATGREASGNKILFVGQLQEFKGLGYLLQALPGIRSANPGIRLQVVYQTGALLDSYQRQVGRLGLAGCVEFAGARSARELARLYSSATVVVSPSLGECLSTVVLEAMSCGAAVVATDVGGIREQLDLETGIIVPPRDSNALAAAVARLLADDGLRRQMGAAARKKVRTQFSVSQMIDRHIQLYERLLVTDERAA